jgi:hypothetical protein
MTAPEPRPAEPEPAEKAEAEGPAPAPSPPRRQNPGRAFLGRFMLGHFVAYPVTFATAAGSIPYAMLARKKELLSPSYEGARSKMVQDVARDMKLTGTEAAQVEIVLGFVMWVCIAILAVLHAGVLPWAFAAAGAARHPEKGDRAVRRGLRIFVAITATTAVSVVLAGVGGWIYVMTQ